MSNPPMPTEQTYGGYTLGYIEGQLAAMSQDGSTLQSLVARIRELEKIIGDIHEAMGEDRRSDDATLPAFVSRFVTEHRERVRELEAANATRTAQRDDAVTLARKWQGKQSTTALRNTELNRRVHRLEADLARAHETNRNLHRRTQRAESDASGMQKVIDSMAIGGPWCVGLLGRAWHERNLEAKLARVTAERDARVVLPEIPERHEVSVVVVYGEAIAAMTRKGEFDSKTLYAASAPTPAAALEALKQKIEAHPVAKQEQSK